MKLKLFLGSIVVIALGSYVFYSTAIERHNAINFAAPIATLRALTTAQNVFFERDSDSNGIKDYASTVQLLQKAGLVHGFSETGIRGINTSWLAGGPYQVYQYNILIPKGVARKEGWTCQASPISKDAPNKFYFVDQTGIIRVERGKPATSSSSPIAK